MTDLFCRAKPVHQLISRLARYACAQMERWRIALLAIALTRSPLTQCRCPRDSHESLPTRLTRAGPLSRARARAGMTLARPIGY